VDAKQKRRLQRTIGPISKCDDLFPIHWENEGNSPGRLSWEQAFNEVPKREIEAKLRPGFISTLQKLEHL